VDRVRSQRLLAVVGPQLAGSNSRLTSVTEVQDALRTIAPTMEGKKSMEARRLRANLMALVSCCMIASLSAEVVHAASYRTTNFVVTAARAEFAKQVADQAEAFRRDLAMQWLGRELPQWRDPCPIRVNAAPHLGAGGATTFMFQNNQPFGWTMEIQGSEERILDAVLPHEITHTIFATHFGCPLPRWADEGACTTVECALEKTKHERMLREFLTSNPPRSIAFNRMVEMKEYPHDIMPLYAQGHSVVQYLLNHGGQQRFVAFLGEAMQSNNWNGAVDKHYGFRDLSDLQVNWVEWVRQGSPSFAVDRHNAAADPIALAATQATRQRDDLVIRGQAPAKQSFLATLTGGDSWYARQRDRQPEAVAQADPHQGPAPSTAPTSITPLPAIVQPAETPRTAARTADQRPRPFTVTGDNVWQSSNSSVVRRPVEDKQRPVEKFDAPLRAGGTIWR
jgi:hypothetical protein